MAVKFTNNAKTTLASSLTNVATSASVVDGSVFPTLGAGEYFYCTFDNGSNNEIVKVTARSGNTLTIVRGVDNTTARAFSTGDSAELRATAGLLTDIQENIAAKSANQTVYNTTTASSATDYDIGIDPSVEANAMVFLNGVMQHHDTFSFSGSTLTFDTAPPDGMALEVIVDNLINLQSSNLTVDTFTAADVGGSPQTDFTLSDSPAAETNLIVFVDGVFQNQDAYTISSNVLTMTDGVVADRVVTVYVINPVNIGTPSDGTVTSAKLSGNITMPANLTVTGDVAFDSPTFVVDNANSRVGIGTALPSTLLDIVGDVKMSADLTVDTNTLYVDSANNEVGIGTLTPNQKLDINGGGLGFQRLGSDITPPNDATGLIFLRQNGNGAGTQEELRYLARNHAWYDNTGARLVSFLQNGKVGIGTDTPDYNLHVEKSSASANVDFMVRNTGTDGTSNTRIMSYVSSTSSGDPKIGLGITGVRDYFWRIDNSDSDKLILDTNGADILTIDTSGNVGIGTSSPGVALDVNGDIRAIKSGGIPVLYLNNGTTQHAIKNSSNEFIFENSGIERLRITNGGRVGIGTSNPSSPLTIGDGVGNYYMDFNSAYGGSIQFRKSGTASFFIGEASQGLGSGNDGGLLYTYGLGTRPIRYYIEGVERFRMTSNGLTFNGDTAAANALDDYEHGTYSHGSLAAYGVCSAISQGSFNNNYVKVGKLITITGIFSCSFSGAGKAIVTFFVPNLGTYANAGEAVLGSMIAYPKSQGHMGMVIPNTSANNTQWYGEFEVDSAGTNQEVYYTATFRGA